MIDEKTVNLSNLFLENFFSTIKGKFKKHEAWLYLLVHANRNENIVKIKKGGITHEIKMKRGQLCKSQLTLAKKWRCGRTTVNRYLNKFQEKGNICYESYSPNNVGITTVITINDYDKYVKN